LYLSVSIGDLTVANAILLGNAKSDFRCTKIVKYYLIVSVLL